MQHSKSNRRPSGAKTGKINKVVPAVLAVMMGAGGGTFAFAAETPATTAVPAASAPAAAASTGFGDVKTGYWAEKHIYKLAAQGIVLGQNGQFKPGDNITRQEAITMAIRFIGAGKELGTIETAIVPDGLTVNNYFKPYVDLALDKGLIRSAEEKDADGKAWGTQPASREWVTRILVRAIGKEAEAQSAGSTSFADNADISKTSVGYVSTAVSLGIAQGIENNKFNPAGSVTRAQMATFFSRAEAHITPTYAGMTTGIVTALSANSVTLYANGQNATYALNASTPYFAAGSETRVQPSELKLYTRVTVAGANAQAGYVEIVDPKAQVETLSGEFDRLTGTNTLFLKTATDYPKYEYDASTVFLDANGSRIEAKNISAGSRVSLLRETYSGQNKILTVQVTSGNVSKTDTGTVAAVDAAAGTVTFIGSTGLSEVYKLDPTSIIRYRNEILAASDLKVGSQIRYVIENNVVRTVEVMQSVERAVTALLYQISSDGSTLTYKTDAGALEVKLIAPKAEVVVGGKNAALQDLIADKALGDRVELTLSGSGEVTRIVVKDREATQLAFAAVSSYDAATGVLAVIDAAGKPYAFTVDATTKLAYNAPSPTLKGIEPLLIKGRGLNLTAVGSRLVSLEIVYKYEGTVERVDPASMMLTLKLGDGTSVKLPYGATGTAVQAYGVSNATMNNVKPGDRVTAALYADRVALQSVAVQTTKQFRVTGTAPGSSRLNVEQAGVSASLFVDNQAIVNVQGAPIGYAGLANGQLVDVTFNGPDVSKVRLADSAIGTIQSVDAAARSVTLLTSTGATRTYSGAVSPLNVNQNGTVVSAASTLAAGQHVQATVQPDGSTSFTVLQALSKSFWRYDAAAQAVYVKITPGSTENNMYKLAPEAWVHQGAANISVQSLVGDDKIVLYLNNNVVYELVKQ